MTFALNPGFVLLIAAALALAAPKAFRPTLMILAAAGAAALAFAPPFGDHAAFRQIGLVITPLRLDATSQILGLGCAIAGVIAGLASAHRSARLEDAAVLTLFGAAAVAAFAGDMVSFIAAASLAMLAAGAIALAGQSPAARAAALRILAWQALAGMAYLTGLGLAWAQGASLSLDRVDPGSATGVAFLVGALIQVGAPPAHVWLRDALSHAGPTGAAAVASAGPLAGAAALIRLFPGEPALLWIGAAMALLAAPFALASPDLRRTLAYGLTAQLGLVVAAVGVGSPLAVAAAAALMFAASPTMAALALLATAPAPTTPARSEGVPLTAMLTVVLAAAAAAAPGSSGYVTRSLLMEAAEQSGHDWLWYALVVAGAATVAHLGLKLPFGAVFAAAAPAARPPFAIQQGLLLGAFVAVAVGLTPNWLYAMLPPGEVSHQPYAPERIVAQAQLLAAAGAVGVVLHLFWPAPQGAGLTDVDWLWRRPGRRLAAQMGGGLLAAYGWWGAALGRVGRWAGRGVSKLGQIAERPDPAARAVAAALLLTASGCVVVFLLKPS